MRHTVSRKIKSQVMVNRARQERGPKQERSVISIATNPQPQEYSPQNQPDIKNQIHLSLKKHPQKCQIPPFSLLSN